MEEEDEEEEKTPEGERCLLLVVCSSGIYPGAYGCFCSPAELCVPVCGRPVVWVCGELAQWFGRRGDDFS